MRKILLLLLTLSLWCLGSGSNELFAKSGYYKADPVLSNIGSQSSNSFFTANTIFAKYINGIVVGTPVVTCPGEVSEVADANCTADITPGVATTSTPNAALANGYPKYQSRITAVGEALAEEVIPNGFFPAGYQDVPVGRDTLVWKYIIISNPNDVTFCRTPIEIIDNTAPVIACSPTVNVVANPGVCFATNVGLVSPTVTELCSNPTTLTYSFVDDNGVTQSGSIAPATVMSAAFEYKLDTTVVTFVATDKSGNSSTCTTKVVVQDNQNPVLANAPADVTFTNDAGICGKVTGFVSPTATDNCSVTVSWSILLEDGTTPDFQPAQDVVVEQSGTGNVDNFLFTAGTHYILYTATDGAGLTDTSFTQVNVTDNEAPVINGCPSDIIFKFNTSTNGGNDCIADVDIIKTPATDNCDASANLTWAYTLYDSTGAVVITDANGDPVSGVNNVNVALTKGKYTVVYTVEDLNGNVSSPCTLQIAVIDNEKPTFTTGLLADLTLFNETPLVCYNDTLLSSPNVTDNCGSITLSWVVKQGTFIDSSGTGPIPSFKFPVGLSTVIWTATDAVGLTVMDTVLVTVTDETLPTVNAGADIAINSSAISCSATIAPRTVTFGDNCGVASITENSVGTLFPINLGAGTATFNGTFPVGSHTVTFTVTDVNGNVETYDLNIEVTDVTLPTINNFVNIITSTDPGLCSFTRSFNIATDFNPADNCSIDSTEVFFDFNNDAIYDDSTTYVGATGTFSQEFAKGVTNVKVVTTDASGNTAQDLFSVTVNDNELPTVFFQDTITINIDPTSCTAALVNLVLTSGLVSDNCTNDATLLLNATNNQTPDGDTATAYYALGYNTLVWTVTDLDGNTTNKTVVIYVRDQNLPSDSPNDTINILADLGVCSGKVKVFAPNSADSCGIASVKYSINGATQVTGVVVDNFPFPVGNNIVQWFTTDNNNNTRIDTAVVIVTDAQAPIITGPTNVVLNATANCAAMSTVAVQVTDNCSLNNVAWTLIHFTEVGDLDGDTLSGSGTSVTFNFPSSASNNVITFTAEDASGNTSVKTITVKVNDTQGPVVNCPGDQIYNAQPGVCGANITIVGDNNIIDAPVTDNCGIQGYTSNYGNPENSAFFPVGVTPVTITVTDISGNTTVCSFNVTVLDNAGPQVSNFPNDTIVDALQNECSRIVFWNEPSAFDACTGNSLTVTRNYQPGQDFPTGVTTVTYVFTDLVGNITTRSFTIRVRDVQNPVISPIASSTLYLPANSCTVALIFNPNVQDNCDATEVPYTSTYASGTLLGVGTYQNTVTATDSSGNSSSITFNVTVIDTIKPVFTSFPTDITSCNPVVNYSVVYSDNCAITSVLTNPAYASGSTFAEGTTTVSYEITDASGNKVSRSFNITVVKATTIANAGADLALCLIGSEVNATLTGTAAASGETPLWSTGNPAQILNPGASSTGVKFVTSGIYTFTYTISGNGVCPNSSDDVVVTVSSQPSTANAGFDQTITTSSTNLGAGSPAVGVGNWSTNGSGVIASPGFTNTGVTNLSSGVNLFIWTVSSGSCSYNSDTVSITVTLPQVDFAGTISSAFTPNGDGENETFEIPGFENYPSASIEIFNRWGSRVFESTGSSYGKGWNGKFEGKELPVASYYYVIDLKDGSNAPVLKGIVSIIR